jgi:DNA polymerase-3 subunit alpha
MRAYDLPKHRVAVTPDLYGELKGLLGPHCLV